MKGLVLQIGATNLAGCGGDMSFSLQSCKLRCHGALHGSQAIAYLRPALWVTVGHWEVGLVGPG